MKIRYLPLLSSLLLFVILLGIWFYALHTVSGATVLAHYAVGLLIVCVSCVGILGVLKLKKHKVMVCAYVASMILVLCGVGSFYIFQELSTINIGGFIAILIGISSANMTAVLFVVTDHIQ